MGLGHKDQSNWLSPTDYHFLHLHKLLLVPKCNGMSIAIYEGVGSVSLPNITET